MKNICGEEWSAVLRTYVSHNEPGNLALALETQPQTAPAALHYAVEYGNIECLKVSLQHCASRWSHIHKAVTQAAEFNILPMVQLLSPFLKKSQNSNAAFAFACAHENTDMMEALWDTSKPEEILEKFKVMGVKQSRVDLLNSFICEKHAQQQQKTLQTCLCSLPNSLQRRSKI